ncbi:MAG: RNA polymerase sigma factor, partial [Anaerolineae bacterium]
MITEEKIQMNLGQQNYQLCTDAELVGACLDDDDHAWAALVGRYQCLVYSIPLKYGLSESQAGDVFQSVWLILLRKLVSLQGCTTLGPWLTTVTRRECWKVLRRLEKAGVPRPEMELSSDPLPEDVLIHLERQTAIREAVAYLPPRCRELINLLFFHNPRLSYAEVGQRIGMPEGSIGPTRARCLEKLKGILQ